MGTANCCRKPERVHRLGEAQVVEQQNQCAAIEPQFAGSERERRRHHDRQFVAIAGELRHHASGLTGLLHRRGDAALFVCRHAERGEIERAAGPLAAAAQHDHVVRRHEHASTQFFKHAQLAELALRGLEFAALGGTLRAALNFSGTEQLLALERLLEPRLLDPVGDDIQDDRDGRAVQHQQQRQPEAQRAEIATRPEPSHPRSSLGRQTDSRGPAT